MYVCKGIIPFPLYTHHTRHTPLTSISHRLHRRQHLLHHHQRRRMQRLRRLQPWPVHRLGVQRHGQHQVRRVSCRQLLPLAVDLRHHPVHRLQRRKLHGVPVHIYRQRGLHLVLPGLHLLGRLHVFYAVPSRLILPKPFHADRLHPGQLLCCREHGSRGLCDRIVLPQRVCTAGVPGRKLLPCPQHNAYRLLGLHCWKLPDNRVHRLSKHHLPAVQRRVLLSCQFAGPDSVRGRLRLHDSIHPGRMHAHELLSNGLLDAESMRRRVVLPHRRRPDCMHNRQFLPLGLHQPDPLSSRVRVRGSDAECGLQSGKLLPCGVHRSDALSSRLRVRGSDAEGGLQRRQLLP